MQKFITSWSGGKDSCFAFMQAVSMGLKPQGLISMMNETRKMSRSHAIPESILKQQALELGLPIVTVPATWQEYEEKFILTLSQMTKLYEVEAAVFGDIDLDDHRKWEEKVCAYAGIECHLPLWQRDRKELVMKMIENGIECIIVSCNEKLGEKFLGKKLDQNLMDELENAGVDVCGENGEFHTLVVNCPLFKKPLDLSFDKKYCHNNYWFQEMYLNN